MLRITMHDAPRTLTVRLEGRLAAPWVRELEACWRGALASQREPILRVDLTEVTSIDPAGQTCLATMQRQGAELVAADCMMKAVVDEITGDRRPGCEFDTREPSRVPASHSRGGETTASG